jgi:pyruvate dehydrogenase E2 component (dihydrolipoamide acetyltransferase)
MATEVILPRVDMDMASGKISRWHVKEGDSVALGAPLFEIETDKAAMEIEAPAAGVVREIGVAEGVTVPVGARVAMIYAVGEAVVATPAAAVQPATTNGEAAAPGVAAYVTVAAREPANGKARATPLARRLAREHGIGLDRLAGSGPGGRVQARDLRAAAVAQVPVAQLVQSGQMTVVRTPMAPPAAGNYEIVPVDNMRRTIAQRLTLAKQTVPHFYLNVVCDLESLLEIREKLNAEGARASGRSPGWKISVNDFVIKALAMALQRVPDANVTWSAEGAEPVLLRHRSSDIAVAVAVDGGLFTPVLRDVETKPLARVSTEMKALAEKARARKLVPSEYQGGSAAISNLGMYGIDDFSAIINPPQSMILAVGAATRKPAVIDDTLCIRTQMTCTLSCDHRAVDGAIAAQLLQSFRSFVEEPALMLA